MPADIDTLKAITEKILVVSRKALTDAAARGEELLPFVFAVKDMNPPYDMDFGPVTFDSPEDKNKTLRAIKKASMKQPMILVSEAWTWSTENATQAQINAASALGLKDAPGRTEVIIAQIFFDGEMLCAGETPFTRNESFVIFGKMKWINTVRDLHASREAI